MIKDATAWLASALAAGSLGFAGCAIIAGLDNTYDLDPGAGGAASSAGVGGGGGSTSCTDSSACNDLNACTIDTCDTAVGICVGTQAPDGPVAGDLGMNPCSTQTCMGGSVLTSFASADTACGATLVCDGMGNCVGCNSPDQCPGAPPCQSRTCNKGVCGVQNVSAGLACQGGVCDGMGACVECLADSDCAGLGSQVCQNGKCVDSCADGMLNGNETDVDCGGGDCPNCADGKICNGDDDCSSDDCSGGLCISCMDGMLNGIESDIDCGGNCQANCAIGKMCNDNADCQSSKCAGGVCQ